MAFGDVFIHPSACVDEGAKLGPGSKVWHFCHVMGSAELGADVSLGQNVFVGANVIIGDGCRLQNNVSVYEGVTLEADVFCGPSMVFTNDPEPRAFRSNRAGWRPTLVSRGATLGANSTIVCGHDIGEYAMVAAGAVVTREVKPFQLVAGAPARHLSWICRCGERLREVPESLTSGAKPLPMSCPRCGERYLLEKTGLRPET
jgi:UDP-2-acetamido-3-amino-2,3-dideoxy-glucuronate N-acetyltransferase